MKTAGPKPLSGPEAEFYRYAYDRNPLRMFTEAQWITHVKALYRPCEPVGELGAYLEASWEWEGHLAGATIIPAEMEELSPPMPPTGFPLPQGTAIGCPSCHRVHRTDKNGWVFPSEDCHAVYNIYKGWEH